MPKSGHVCGSTPSSYPADTFALESLGPQTLYVLTCLCPLPEIPTCTMAPPGFMSAADNPVWLKPIVLAADRKNKRHFGAGALRTTRWQPRLARGMHARLAPGGSSTLRSAPEKGWSGAARFPLGLDTSRRTGYGRTAVQGLQSLTPEEKPKMLWKNPEQLLDL